jgi:hypothetical protein
MANIFLFQIYHIPIVSYLKTIANQNKLYYNSHQNYKKASLRNRTYIPTANGIQMLSVPIKNGKNEKQLYKDVLIDYSTNWQKVHWKAIYFTYKNAAYFEYYEKEIEHLYTVKHEYLIGYNLAWLQLLIKFFNLKIELIDLAESKIAKTEMDLISFDYKQETAHKNEYYQIFSEKTGFIPNMSCIDLLYNEGPTGLDLITL